MTNSSEVAILYRVSELARRYGLRPSEAEATFSFCKDDPDDQLGHFRLIFDTSPGDAEKYDKFKKMKAALGCEGHFVRTNEVEEMEDLIERAIALAPRSRTFQP